MKCTMTFLGAYDCVTGSKTLLQHGSKNYLVDCGLFQGGPEMRQRNREDLSFSASSIHAVFLTHAHLDHCGYLPKIYREGFRGKVYCSEGTYKLAEIILKDAAHLEEELALYARQTGYSRHEDPQPLFRTEDAEHVLNRFEILARHQWHELDEGLSFQMMRSGHLVGSSFLQFQFDSGFRKKTLTFSGDIGNHRSLTLKGPEAIEETDTLVLESTYGDRLHSPMSALVQMGDCLSRVIERGGTAIIPAFAVGRSQEILYMIAELERLGKIPSVPVILDSPMSKKAMIVFLQNLDDQVFDKGFGPSSKQFFPKQFSAVESADESMLVTMRDGPQIVISASGMLSGGRVLHHLKHRLPRSENMVIFSGYQAPGSKGRYLQDQGTVSGSLRIHHTEVQVAAEICTVDALSSHADYNEMLDWLKGNRCLPKRIILNHGEPEAQAALAEFLHRQLGVEVVAAQSKQRWELSLFGS